MQRKIILTLFCIFFLLKTGDAQLRLAKIFSSNMVFQSDVPVSIWGWAEPNSGVSIIFKKKATRTKADKNGFWKKQFNATSAGGPYQIQVTSNKKSIQLTNVMFGDVWLCGGQSNMEWFVENSKNADEEISNATHPNIRLFEVPQTMATHPKDDFDDGEWTTCSPKTIAQFSAVGYFFGRDLQPEINKPIGLISNNYGGTVVEAWTSAESLTDMPI